MRKWPAALFGVALLIAACTDSYLYDDRREGEPSEDRAVSVEGHFCTLGTNDVVRPIKLLLAMDASQSMRVTDPDGTRARALLELLEFLPEEPEIEISVMLFAGSTTAYLTRDGLPRFEQLVSLTESDRLRLAEIILNFQNPDANRDSTDFVKALSDIYALISKDIADTRANDAEARARYSVIFLSDGHPTTNQDNELIEGDAVVRVRELRQLTEDVRLNTVFVFNPTQPVAANCDFSGDAGTGCPLLIVNEDSERLEKMAELGGGDFRDFRNDEPINFLRFRFGQTRRAYTLQSLLVTNRSALPGSPLDTADTDGDGASDAEEREAGTDPNVVDTDGDGFSDGVEIRFARLGASFNPARLVQPDGGGADPGCPLELRGVDQDCDGLLDCDEQLVGTNPTRVDSDGDGAPDQLEWLLGTQGASDDLDQDPDNDGLTSRAELALHTSPGVADPAHLTRIGYRTRLELDGPPDTEGSQCYRFRVDNISLAETVEHRGDGGTLLRGPGFNSIDVSVAMKPVDDPTAPTELRHARGLLARHPLGGIKSPPDGLLRVTPEDFVDRCETR